MLDELEAKSLQAKGWDHYVAMCRRRRWSVILPAFVVWGAVWAVSWFLPVAYKSDTLILVEKQQVPQQYVVSNVVSDLQGRLQTMTQQILSRSRLARIIDEFQLYRDSKGHSNLDEMVDKMRKDITIEPVQTPGRPAQMQELNAFRISYTSSDPRLAQQVTGRLTSLFIDENLKTREQQSENTTSFLEAQLAEAGKALNEQEQRIRDFKSKYLGALPDQLGSNMNIMNGLQTRLQSEMQALSQSKQQSLYLQSLLEQYRSIREAQQQGSTDTNVPPALDQELTRLKTQLADVQSHYTERHPDYRKLKEQIVKVEKMKQQMASDLQAAAQTQTDSKAKDDAANARPTSLAEMKEMSPMLQVEGQLKANEFEIQTRQKMIDQLEAQIQQYQARLNEAPVREQQLSDLTRDYEQSKANYGSLLAKKDQSELATSLEKRQQGEQFVVIDPPTFPFKPYKPDRLLISLGGLLVGVMVGITAAGFAEVGDDRIFDEADLQDLVKAPILSEIPALPTVLETAQARRRVRFEWMGVTAMLLLTAGGFLVTMIHG